MQIHMKIWLLYVVDVFFLSQPCYRVKLMENTEKKGFQV